MFGMRGDQVHKPFLRLERREVVVVVGLGAVTGNSMDPTHPMGIPGRIFLEAFLVDRFFR